jgi:hypothetical protein
MSHNDIDSNIFGRILNNSLPENFIGVAEALRVSGREIFEDLMRDTADEESIQTMWTSGFPFSVADQIAKKMYVKPESDQLQVRFAQDRQHRKDLQKAKEAKDVFRKHRAKESSAAETLTGSQLLNMIIRFQIELTSRFLSEIIRTFTYHEIDDTGTVDQRGLRGMLEILCKDINQFKKDTDVETAEIDRIIDETSIAIDMVSRPCTFSECVDRFAVLLSARLDFKKTRSAKSSLAGLTKAATFSPRKPSNNMRLGVDGDKEFGEILGVIKNKLHADARYDDWRKERVRGGEIVQELKSAKSPTYKKKDSSMLPTQALTFEPSRLALGRAVKMYA